MASSSSSSWHNGPCGQFFRPYVPAAAAPAQLLLLVQSQVRSLSVKIWQRWRIIWSLHHWRLKLLGGFFSQQVPALKQVPTCMENQETSSQAIFLEDGKAMRSFQGWAGPKVLNIWRFEYGGKASTPYTSTMPLFQCWPKRLRKGFNNSIFGGLTMVNVPWKKYLPGI